MNLQQIILSLLSGLLGSVVGAVVGGYLSYKGAVDSSKTQIESIYDQEKGKREYEKKREEQIAINALLSEAKENLDLSNKWQISHSKSILSTETWALYKGFVQSLPSSLQEKLIKSYAEIKRYNSLTEYDRARVDFGSGALDQVLQKQASVVAEVLIILIEDLGNHLSIVLPSKNKGGEK